MCIEFYNLCFDVSEARILSHKTTQFYIDKNGQKND
jgi:hypothetical protein